MRGGTDVGKVDRGVRVGAGVTENTWVVGSFGRAALVGSSWVRDLGGFVEGEGLSGFVWYWRDLGRRSGRVAGHA